MRVERCLFNPAILRQGERLAAEGAPGEEASLHLVRWRTLTRVLAGSDIGFAQSVIDGDCDWQVSGNPEGNVCVAHTC